MLLPLLTLLALQDPSAVLLPEPPPSPGPDWLLDAAPFEADLYASPDGRGVVLSNGLVRREVRVVDGAAMPRSCNSTTMASLSASSSAAEAHGRQ